MGRKLGFTSLFFKPRDKSRTSPYVSSFPSPSYSWPWPSCKHPKTISFRAADGDNIYKTVNSVYLDSAESCFTHSSEESASFSTASEESGGVGSLESVIRGLRSDRLFFKPGDTSSILEEAKDGAFPFKESIALAMESEDPYKDFRVSMEEMVVAHGLKDWECLEELLLWYLRVNGKKTHGYIVGAFVDLLVGLASPPSSSSSSSMSSQIKEVEEEGSESC
ncbi:transcription repressor OFP13-like [Phoenix dactylifera]|uniref:Transcription repressor n=1 Tax=Phoenix dactylifera TaxID=42345 RepID=A0A8B7MVF5_PHODC|nr:transcription repressor OFP13-like [Phoenix dactylifera]